MNRFLTAILLTITIAHPGGVHMQQGTITVSLSTEIEITKYVTVYFFYPELVRMFFSEESINASISQFH